MDLDNLVRCESCVHYNRQYKDCAARDYSKIANEVRLRNCDKYSQDTKSLLRVFIENIIALFRRS